MLSRAFQRTVLVILDLWVFCVVLALVYHTFLLHDAMKFEEAMETLQLDWWIFEPNHILWAFQHHVIFTHGQHSTQPSNSRNLDDQCVKAVNTVCGVALQSLLPAG